MTVVGDKTQQVWPGETWSSRGHRGMQSWNKLISYCVNQGCILTKPDVIGQKSGVLCVWAHVLAPCAFIRWVVIWKWGRKCWLTCRSLCFTLSLIVFLTHPPAVHPFSEDSIARLLSTSGCRIGNIPLITSTREGLAKAECRHDRLSLPSICSWRSRNMSCLHGRGEARQDNCFLLLCLRHVLCRYSFYHDTSNRG